MPTKNDLKNTDSDKTKTLQVYFTDLEKYEYCKSKILSVQGKLQSKGDKTIMGDGLYEICKNYEGTLE